MHDGVCIGCCIVYRANEICAFEYWRWAFYKARRASAAAPRRHGAAVWMAPAPALDVAELAAAPPINGLARFEHDIRDASTHQQKWRMPLHC